MGEFAADDVKGLPGGDEGAGMVAELRVDGAELEVILSEAYISLSCRKCGGRVIGIFARVEVEDERFDVAGALLELPQVLEAVGLVMQDALNQATVGHVPLNGSRLQQLLGRLEINQRLLPPFPSDADNSPTVKLLHPLSQPLCVNSVLLRSASILASSSDGRVRSCLRAASVCCSAISLFIIWQHWRFEPFFISLMPSGRLKHFCELCRKQCKD
jgi:hypothetical protein